MYMCINVCPCFCVCDLVYVRETNREIEQDPLANNSKFVDLDNKGCIICDAHFVTDGFCFFIWFVFVLCDNLYDSEDLA